ncbi:allophanate hydrolase [Paenibacillus radicis (ex Gao et al. 2016)]|uniref:Allophanate hydrolase n=1 Tax=Paenibacillus radicis (ex Gao et al. 2016) TaxID=1737354 RepID=A0A917HS41_9BACL|nr:allophanate hydrolase [Paenibacillus radicis (ex Gao et al. 2016)]GGG87608.1 allophanate hydrolase [Paenibacillus radicis (ex Gao et al. 2016)]
MTELPNTLSIGWLKEQYAAGLLTPEVVIANIVERAKADEAKNIWITPPSIAHIRPYLDRLADLAPADAPLWGIPFAVKDNMDVAGLPTTAGCAEYTFLPAHHAAVVERLVEAGAIPVGKSNLDQFATGLVGTRSPYGETANSLRPELISGGSSSGSAVAVALGHAAFALGTDTAGSGRVPAALNGLIGFKPSLGAWPVKGVVPACESLDCVTVFAHTLEDVLAVDQVARGAHASDPWSRNLPQPAAKLPSKLYLPKNRPSFYGSFADVYSKAWDAEVARLNRLEEQGQLGMQIEYIDDALFSEAAAILYDGPWIAERWAEMEGFVESSQPGTVFPVTEQVLRSGGSDALTAASVFRAMHKLAGFKLEVRQLLADAVLVMPTCGGTWTREEVRLNPVATNSAMGLYTNHCNLLDLCAVAIPAGEAEADLPFGITLFALAEDEGLIVGAAARAMKVEVPVHVSGDDSVVVDRELSLLSGKLATTLIAVCGLHMRGFPLEKQMLNCEAAYIRTTRSAANYKLFKLPTVPAKPGMIKVDRGGSSIEIELWEMPSERFGEFVASIPAPLGIGKIELEDGSAVPGFICEGYAAQGAEDITASGGWRYV